MASIVERKPVIDDLGAGGLDEDQSGERGRREDPGHDRDAAVVPLGDREEGDQRPETLVGDLPLDEVRMSDRRSDRHDEDRDRPPTTDDQRHRLEQQERDAEWVGLAGLGHAGSQRDERQRRQPQGDRRVDEPGHQVLGRARASRHPDSVRAAQGGHIIPGVDSGTRPWDERPAESPSRYAWRDGSHARHRHAPPMGRGSRGRPVGHGPTLIHMPGVPFSNVEGEWRIPAPAALVRGPGRAKSASSSTTDAGRADRNATSRTSHSRRTSRSRRCGRGMRG